MNHLLIAQLTILAASCVLSAMVAYHFGRRAGRRLETIERIRRMESMYDSLAETWDENTMPKKWQQPRGFRWN